MTPVFCSKHRRWRGAVFTAMLAALAAAGPLSPDAGAAVFNPKTFTLENGLKVVVIENHRMPVVRQALYYRVGSADDPRGKSGLAHYLEHLMFKGTRTTKPNEFSKIVARHGGRDNAFTSPDATGYHQTVAKDRLELIMRMEADRMANLVVDPMEAGPELQVVMEERRSRVDNRPSAQLDEQLAAALFVNYPYRIPVIGWQHELDTLTLADAMAFYRKYYVPNNAILVITGDVTLDEVKPLAEKYYGPIPRGPEVVRRANMAEPPPRVARRITLRSNRVREPRWGRDYLAPSRGQGKHREADALEVLDIILGTGATSRLYRALVIEKKLALSIGSVYDADLLGPTAFSFYGRPRRGVTVAQLEAAVEAEIAKLLKHGVSDAEVAAAKKRLLAGAVFARDSLRRGSGAIGTALTSGQTIADVENWPDKIKAVTAAQILAAAREVFREERSVTGLLLPEKKAERGAGARRGGGK
ncbi:MAG: pitrilysin family protein [Alphaproteobacteria bacterium]|nr:pitrilysin family protein [Alphaproteobacteria bacterium]